MGACAGVDLCGSMCWSGSLWEHVLEWISLGACAGVDLCGSMCWSGSLWEDGSTAIA